MEIGEEYLPNVLRLDGIAEVSYTKEGSLAEAIRLLEGPSLVRRNTNDKFQQYMELIKELKSRMTRTSISLKEETRLDLARKDEALAEMEKSIGGGASADDKGDEEAKKENDLILNETLQILCDFIELKQRASLGSVGVDKN